jgi:hypothetical protein
MENVRGVSKKIDALISGTEPKKEHEQKSN